MFRGISQFAQTPPIIVTGDTWQEGRGIRGSDLFGGEAIKGFAVVMLCGVLICTYSAIFISTPVLIYLGLMLSGARSASERSGVPQPAE